MRELKSGSKAVEFQLELILWKQDEISRTQIKLSSATAIRNPAKISATNREAEDRS